MLFKIVFGFLIALLCFSTEETTKNKLCVEICPLMYCKVILKPSTLVFSLHRKAWPQKPGLEG